MSSQRQPGHHEVAYIDHDVITHADLVVASHVIDVIAAEFELDQGLVRAIPIHDTPGGIRPAVVYIGDGLDFGDWRDINDRDYEFITEIDEGIEVDTRDGMIYPTFASMVRLLNAQAAGRGKVFNPKKLPPSKPDARHRHMTWLTGYGASFESGEALVGLVRSNGDPTIQTRPIDRYSPVIGFRPAVIIGEELVAQYAELHPSIRDL